MRREEPYARGGILHRICATLVCVALSAVSTVLHAEESPSAATPWDEVEKAWSRLLEATGPTEYSAVVTSRGEEDQYFREYTYHLQRRGDQVIYSERTQETDPDGSTHPEEFVCYGRNADYRFVISKSAEQDPWVLRALIIADSDPRVTAWERYLNIFTKSIDIGTLLVHDELIMRLLRVPNATIHSCHEVQHGEGLLLEVGFTYDVAEGDRNLLDLPARSMRGTVLLDPSASYVVREARLTLPAMGSTWERIYESVPGHPQLQQGHVTKWTSGGKKYGEVHTLLSISFDREFDDTEFRLTAFGLPEPESLPRVWTHGKWLLGVCVVLLIVAALRLMSRRR